MVELPPGTKLQLVSSATFLTAKVRVNCQHEDMTNENLPSQQLLVLHLVARDETVRATSALVDRSVDTEFELGLFGHF
jgi:hypothetical protein